MSIIDLNAGLTKVESGLTSYNSYDPTVAKYFLAATPSLYGNFAVTKSTQTFLPGLGEGPLLSATRSSNGTYVDYDGLIKTAGIGVPRFTHDQTTGECLGLLVEESRTNLFNYSEDVTVWSGPTGVTNNTTDTRAPDGQFTASKLSPIVGTSYGGGYAINNTGISYSQNTTYSLSFFIKSGGSSATQFAIVTNTTNFTGQAFWVNSIPINPSTSYTLSRTTPSNIPTDFISNLGTFQRIPYPNGWTKVVWTFTTGSNSPFFRDFAIYHSGYTALNGTGNQDMYVWGFQLEAGSFPTSYIRTTGSSATRSADQVSLALNYEAARTNLFTRSQELNLSPWSPTNVIITANADTAPDLTATAERVTNIPNQLSFIGRFLSLNYNTTYTVSVFAKNVSGNGVVAFELERINSNGFDVVTFNTVNQTITTSLVGNSQIISVGNGWYRLVTTFTTPSSGTYSAPPRFNVFYIGAYGGVSTTNTVALWGAQLEIGSTVSSYIPTTSTTATGSGPSTSGTWFDITKTSGTTYFEYDLLYDQATGVLATQGLYGIYDSSSSYSNGNTAFIDVEYNSSVNHRPRTRIKDTVSNPITESILDRGPSEFSSGMNKLMVGFDSTTFRSAQNGNTSSTTNTVDLSVLATRTNTSLTFNGSSQYTGSKIIKRFIYWDQLLTSNLFTSLTI
jgi:hypothetical protein